MSNLGLSVNGFSLFLICIAVKVQLLVFEPYHLSRDRVAVTGKSDIRIRMLKILQVGGGIG